MRVPKSRGFGRLLRRRLIATVAPDTDPVRRGFYEKCPATRERLEKISDALLAGYTYAVEAETPATVERPLRIIPANLRGFAYEGAAMGFAVRDGMSLGCGGRFARFLAGPGTDHSYAAHAGLGRALARLPKFLWPRADAVDPSGRWPVLDGYGFHQACFDPDRYIHGQSQESRFPWSAGGATSYGNRAIDHGIGRAIWFVGGADARLAIAMINRFPSSRRPDLYGGAGFAATYAGGADAMELEMFWQRAGVHRPQVAQGSAFAADAHVRAGLTVQHTCVASRVFCDMTPFEVARLTDEARPAQGMQGDLPLYEVWRQRVADELAARRGSARPTPVSA
jgi:hypothetical protein